MRILDEVATIYVRTIKAEAENGFRTIVFSPELADPKEHAMRLNLQFCCFRKGIRLKFRSQEGGPEVAGRAFDVCFEYFFFLPTSFSFFFPRELRREGKW